MYTLQMARRDSRRTIKEHRRRRLALSLANTRQHIRNIFSRTTLPKSATSLIIGTGIVGLTQLYA